MTKRMRSPIDNALGFHDAALWRFLEQQERMVEFMRNAAQPLAGIQSPLIENLQRIQTLQEVVRRTQAVFPAQVPLQALASRLDAKNSLADVLRQASEWAQRLDMLQTPSAVTTVQRWSAVQASLAWIQGTELALQSAAKIGEVTALAGAWPSDLLAPLRTFTDFSKTTLAQLDEGQSTEVASALMASLEVGGKELVRALSLVGQLPAGLKSPATRSATPEFLLFRVQQQELVSSGLRFEAGDDDSVLTASRAARTATLALSVMNKLAKSMHTAELSTGAQLFKPTSSAFVALARTPLLVAKDEVSLGALVDCLYTLFYEAAGADHLRFLGDDAGLLQDDDCQFIWTLKVLRNKWLRHDREHGDPVKQEEDRVRLLETLRSLGLAGPPIGSEDFRLLQHRLIEEADHFLDQLLEAIRRRNEKP